MRQEAVKPRILYIGQLWEGGTCLDRMRTLRDLECEMMPFDITPYQRGYSRPLRSLASRFNWGPPILHLNRDLLAYCRAVKCVDYVWVDKGMWVHPDTLAEIRNTMGATTISYTPDPQFFRHRSGLFEDAIPLYDIVITTKSYEVESYKNLGARKVLLSQQTFSKQRFFAKRYPATEKKRFLADVCFVGHYERHYARRVGALARQRMNVRVWGGGGWKIHRALHPSARRYIAGRWLWGERYPAALRSTRIGLGLLSKLVPEQHTTRTFEIPACGSFLLAERTEEHLQFFEEGKEAEFFSDDRELVDKAKFYLIHDDARQRIAQHGHERCLKSGYSDDVQLAKLLRAINASRV
jgi:hypothetical protein